MKSKFKSIAAACMACVMIFAMSAAVFAANQSLPADTGTLTIHKYLMDDVADAAQPNNGHEAGTNGNPEVPEDAEALEGVTFGVWKINTVYDSNGNLTSPVTFPETAADAEQMLEEGTLSMTKVGNYTTDENGEVTISGLNGYFYVKELRSSKIQAKDVAEPFITAVPMTDASAEPANSSWITDVHVYPKNSPLNISKTVNDAMISMGRYYEQDNILTWKINSDIPSNIADAAASISAENGGYYRVIDELDRSFSYTQNSLKVYAGMAKNTQTLTLVKDTDYKLYVNQKSDASAAVITVDLTKPGMEKLAEGIDEVPYTNLFISFNSVLKDDASQNTAIKNVPKTYFSADPESSFGTPENPDSPEPDPETPNIPSVPKGADVPYAVVGSIVLTKVTGDGNTALEGAKFKIATSEQNAKDGVYMKVNGQEDAVAVSKADGSVTFTNLPLTPEFDVVGEFTGFEEEAYWLVEVEAPNGYNLLSTPIKVPVLDDIAENEVDSDGNSIANHIQFKAGIDRINNVDFSIVNTKNFILPQTGGTGMVLFTVLGIVLMGAAAILLIVTRKKKAQQ